METNNRELMRGVLVTQGLFPYGSAISSRVRNLLKLFIECGYDMHIISPSHTGEKQCPELENYQYSVEFVEAKESVLSLMGLGGSKPYVEAVSTYLETHRADFILSTNMPFATSSFSKMAHKNNCKLVLENCEWFDASSFRFGFFNPYYQKHIKQIRSGNEREADGIIAISRLLESHYSSIPVIRIPTILDVENTSAIIEKTEGRKIKIVFAGSLGGGKENLKPIFEALSHISIEGQRIELDIYGPSRSQVIENIGGNLSLMRSVEQCVNIHGRVSQKVIGDILATADFSIFIRPVRRSSNAGFPTKLAESMAVGTPVITNITGDIPLYLTPENGFLLEKGTSDEVEGVFKMILSLSQDQRNEMRKRARLTAINSFDFRTYKPAIQGFMNTVLHE